MSICKRLPFLIFLASTVSLSSAFSADTEKKTTPCLECHTQSSYRRTQFLHFSAGESLPVFLDRNGWKSSVHADKVSCTDCHTEIRSYPHRTVPPRDKREFSRSVADSCKKCHFAHYTRLLDSIHFKLLAGGVAGTPSCVDCHGSHEIKKADEPRISINLRCGKCHGHIEKEFRNSVHGAALVNEDNKDVPVCTSCHNTHDIVDLRRTEYKLNSYKMCGHCHSDQKRMKKYGLNPYVVTTYLEDFHGQSNLLYSLGAGIPTKVKATCTDCHGSHNITTAKSRDHSNQVRENIATTCRQCHSQATPAFANAWLSHYTPTLVNAPLVWGVKWFFSAFNLLLVLAILSHVLFDLWRYRAHRRRA